MHLSMLSPIVGATHGNWPISSCLLPPFQDKSLCKIIHMKMSLICETCFPMNSFAQGHL